jgi:uncharacterized membrane protein YphA (DoxX/SURF4 family)
VAGLEAFGTRSLRWGLGAASVGVGLVALGRALGAAEPLAPWADGLGAVPLGAPLGIALAVALLGVGALLLAGRLVSLAAGLLALLLVGGLVVAPPGWLGAIQDLGLLGGALALTVVPPAWLARLPSRLAVAVAPAAPLPALPSADPDDVARASPAGAAPLPAVPEAAPHDVPSARAAGTGPLLAGQPPAAMADARTPGPGNLQRLALRVGLALTFLLAGWGKFANTAWYADLLAASGGVAGWPLIGGLGATGALLWLGTGEILLSGLLVWGPPARLASALAALLLALDVLALHAPALVVCKAVGLLGAAIAGYCWASGATVLENAQIGWLRASARADAPPGPR